MLDITMDVRAGTHNEDPEWKDGRGAVLMYVLAVDAAARELRREWVLEKVDADDAERGCWRNSLVIEATRLFRACCASVVMNTTFFSSYFSCASRRFCFASSNFFTLSSRSLLAWSLSTSLDL